MNVQSGSAPHQHGRRGRNTPRLEARLTGNRRCVAAGFRSNVEREQFSEATVARADAAASRLGRGQHVLALALRKTSVSLFSS